MTAVLAFDTFTEVIECRTNVLGPVLPQLLACSLEVALNKRLELNTREQAMQVTISDVSSVPALPYLSCSRLCHCAVLVHYCCYHA